ncbi:hypothetical protein [Burkholderia sp. PU8-34]
MDRSVPTADGVVPVVLEVLFWIFEQTAPELVIEIENGGLRESLILLICEYAALRGKAQESKHLPYIGREPNDSPIEYTRIDVDDLLNALPTERSSPASTFLEIFDSIYADIEEALQAVDSIPWGDEDIEDCWKRWPHPQSTGLLFDHHYYYVEAKRLRDPFADSTAPLELAKRWLTSTLEDMDNGRHSHFWSTVDPSVLGEWFCTTSPYIAKIVEDSGLMSAFHDAATSYVGSMRDIEHRWHRLSGPLRALISARTASADDAIAIIASAIDIHAHQKDQRMSIARQVYAMFCRRLNPQRTAQSCNLFRSPASNSLIERVRQDSASWKTCYLVDTEALPSPFEERIAARQCLVVRLPETWLQLTNELTADTGLDSLFSRMSTGGQSLASLIVNRSFWAPYEQLWPLMRAFRNEVPVVYVFDAVSILALYQLNHFVDLKRIANTPFRHWPSITLDTGDWRYASQSYTSALLDETQVKPSILTTVVNLTTHARAAS